MTKRFLPRPIIIFACALAAEAPQTSIHALMRRKMRSCHGPGLPFAPDEPYSNRQPVRRA